MSVIVKQNVRLVGQLRDKKIRKAVVIVVLESDAHARGHFAGVVQGRAGVKRDFSECAISVVVKKELLGRVVGYKNIHKAVTIIVGKGDSQSMPFFCGDSGSPAYILKRPVPAVVVKNVRCRAEFAWRAIHRLLEPATSLARFRSPIEIAGHKEVQLSIVVVVKESCRHRPSARRSARFCRNIREGAVTIIVVEDVLPEVRYVNIRKAVVVVVPDSNSHSVIGISRVLQTGLHGDVSERAVFVLTVKTVPVCRVVPFEMSRAAKRVRHAACIHQKNIEQAVIVVIEKGHAAGHGLNQVLARRWRIAQDEIDAVERRELELGRASYKLGKDREGRQHKQDTAFANHPSHSGYGSAAVLASLLAGGCVSLRPAICASAVFITEL